MRQLDYKTSTNYEMFTCDKMRNRLVTEQGLKTFFNLHKACRFSLEDYPILINDDFIIIDGQHRFETAKRLKLPIHYGSQLKLAWMM